MYLTLTECFYIGSRIGKNILCRFDKTCTSISCCVDLKLFIYQHTLTAYVRYNTCNLELIIGLNEWTASFNMFEQDFSEWFYSKLNLLIISLQ